jgi:hypothetical protein
LSFLFVVEVHEDTGGVPVHLFVCVVISQDHLNFMEIDALLERLQATMERHMEPAILPSLSATTREIAQWRSRVLEVPMQKCIQLAVQHIQQFLSTQWKKPFIAQSNLCNSLLQRSQETERRLSGPVIRATSIGAICTNNLAMLRQSVHQQHIQCIHALLLMSSDCSFAQWIGHVDGKPPLPPYAAQGLHEHSVLMLWNMEIQQRTQLYNWEHLIFQNVCVSWRNMYAVYCGRHNFYLGFIFNENGGDTSITRDEGIMRALVEIESDLLLFGGIMALLFLPQQTPLLSHRQFRYFLLSLEPLKGS